jgi:hypothetical protein
MNHVEILKKSWKILWNYRALWLFGFIVALTSPRGNNGGNGGRGSGNNSSGSFLDWPKDMKFEFYQLGNRFTEWWNPEIQHTVIIIGIVILIIGLLLGAIFAVGRYVSQTAMILMVDRYEETGEKVSWRKGFFLGWSRAAWRLFLVNLVIYLPLVLVIITMIGIAFLPLLLGVASVPILTWTGVVSTIGLIFLVIFVIFLVVVALSLVMEMIYRVVVLQNSGVIEGIRLGLKLVRSNLKDVFVMWLLLVGIQVGFSIFLLPVVLVLGAIGLLLGGGSGMGIFFLIQAVTNTTAGWIGGGIFGLSLFIVIMVIPLAFLGGLLETYSSTVWTLVYHSVVAPVALLPDKEGLEERSVLPE